MKRMAALGLHIGIAMCAASVASSATSIEREFRFEADRFTVREHAGITTVEVEGTGSSREFEAGHPDLPWVTEQLELPAGAQATGVQVLSVETTALASGARIPSAMRVKPGLDPIERTAPDPRYFSAGIQPETPVRLGLQTWVRGRNMLWLRLSPVRWNPESGRLERIDRLRVRLTLGSKLDLPVPRERVVPEWEGGLGSGAPAARGRVEPLSSRAGDPKPQPFSATQIPSLLGSPVAYVIITGDSMASAFQALADWKTQSGVPAVVRTLSFIQQQYPSASDDAERIRLFIRDAYSRWGTRWVLLGGDTPVIPTRLPHTNFFGGEYIASDLYYSCLDGNWNADGDGIYGEAFVDGSDPGDDVDFGPEVWVGRAPVTTTAQATLFVNKTLKYQKQPAGDYENGVLIFAEVLFPQDWQTGQPTQLDGAEMSEEFTPYLNGHPGIHTARLYQNYTDSRWPPGAKPESRAAVLDSMNLGYNYCVHIGHGYRNVMSVGDANLVNSDAMALSNTDRFFNLYATNCTSNAIDFPCIGEAFLLAPSGGAVTNVGSTRLDFPAAARAYEKEFFRLIYADTVNAVGEAQARQKLPFLGYVGDDLVHRWTQYTELLLGDPELRVYTARPRVLTVTHPSAITLSDSSLTVLVNVSGAPLANARVAAYKPDDEYRVGTTGGSGSVTLPFRPDGVGSFTLTVTGRDCRPYQAQVTVNPTSQPVLVDTPVFIDDDNASGTSGNNDNKLDAGETVDLRVQLRNVGGASAMGVVGTLSTTDPYVSFQTSTLNYGPLAPGATSIIASGFRISVPYTTPDQHEIPFKLRWTESGGKYGYETFQVVVHAAELKHYSHTISDAGGNGNGIPDPGETITFTVRAMNLGSGPAQTVTAKLRSHDGQSVVTDSTASWGTLAAGEERAGDPFVYVPSSSSARLRLILSDQYGVRLVQILDLGPAAAPTGLNGTGSATTTALTWDPSSASDLLGYNLYRASAEVGPFAKINPSPTDRTSYFLDEGLAALTRYYYQVAAVDSSGNESARSAVASVSTNPPNHAIFPIPMGASSSSSVAVDHMYQGYPVAIAAGADVLYMWHPDGTAPVDADGGESTSGDFTERGMNYVAPPSLADVNGDGIKEVVGSSWDSTRTYLFNRQGGVLPGWPVVTQDPVWSGTAIGDLDNDGQKELVFGSNGRPFYAFHANGTEVRDGDSNPATLGVFRMLDTPFNYGTPALADVDSDGFLNIVYGSQNGWIHVWKSNGTNAPGFPIHVPGNIYGSIAVGYLDGPTDTQLDLIVPMSTSSGDDSLYAFRGNGARRLGWPVAVRVGGTNLDPSPALADMNSDGFTDVVYAANNGGIYVFDGNGGIVQPFDNLRYSTLTSGATESSPVVADINGDGLNDIVIGDETARLSAISGTGTMLPGFPIVLAAEIKGTPALCDCDGDGKTEIVTAGFDQNLYVWDYDFPFSPGGPPPWPQFHHDAARTGSTKSPVFVDVEPEPEVRALEFAFPFPNPAAFGTRFRYAIPAERAGAPYEIAVYDIAGRRVAVIDRGTAKSGRFSAQWNLRDSGGSVVKTGVYFVRFRLGNEDRTHKLAIVH